MPSRYNKPVVSHANTAPAYWQIGNLWRVIVKGVQSENSFTLLDQIVTDGGGGGPCTPRFENLDVVDEKVLTIDYQDTHTQDEGLYVVSGRCTFNGGGKDGIIATAGTFVSVPRLTQHSFTVDAPDTQLLNFYLPAGFEQLLTGIAHPADRNEPPPPGVPLPPAWLVEKLAEDYGQTAILGMPFKDPAGANKMRTEATPGATLCPYTSKAQEVSPYWYEGGLHSLLASTEQTDGVYCLIEQMLPQMFKTHPHINRLADEVFYVLEGKCTFLLDEKIETVGQNGMVFIPKGVVKAMRVDSATARVLNLHTPSGFERLVTRLGERAESYTLPPPDHAAIAATTTVRENVIRETGLQGLIVANPL